MKRNALLFAVALLVRLVFLVETRDSVFFEVLLGDGEGYERFARRLVANGWRPDEAFYQAPLYPYFLATTHALFGPGLTAARLIQAFGGAAGCVLLADAAGRFFTPRVGLVSGWLLALYAPAVYYDATIEKTSLSLFLFTLFLCLLARARGRVSLPPGAALSLGASIGALSVLRENLLALFAVVAVWMWSSLRERRLVTILLCLAGVAAVQAPFVAHNWSVGRTLSASSHFGPNLYIGNSADADGLYVPLTPGRGSWEHERDDARARAEAAVGMALSPGEVSRHWAGRALLFAREHPLEWAQLTLRKLHLALHAREWMDSVSYDVVRDTSGVLLILGLPMRFGLLVPLATVGLWLSWRRSPRPNVLYACIALITASVVLFFVFARYRFTLVPLLIPFAALALAERRSWLPARWRTGAALFAGALVLVHLPVDAREHRRSDTYSNVAGALLERGEAQRAHDLLVGIVRREPEYPLPHVNLGKALIALGRLDEARDVLERAKAHAPGALADLELGRAHAIAGDYDGALALFESARARGPLNPEVHASLGLLYARTGRPDEAETTYRIALRLRPDYAAVHNDLGYLLQGQRRFEQAAGHYELALRSEPDHAQALPNLAWLRCAAPVDAARDGAAAVLLAERFVRLVGEGNGGAQDLLGAARAEAGDFEGALAAARNAQATADGAQRLALETRIEAYERGVPYRY